MSGRILTGLRFPPELHAALTAAAEERGLTFNYLVNRLCSEGLACLIPADELRFTRPRPAHLVEGERG